MTKAQARKQITTLIELARAIIETVEQTDPTPAPEGVIYAAMMAHMDLNTFQRLVQHSLSVHFHFAQI